MARAKPMTLECDLEASLKSAGRKTGSTSSEEVVPRGVADMQTERLHDYGGRSVQEH